MSTALAHGAQVIERAVEERRLGEHRDRGGAAPRVAVARSRPDRSCARSTPRDGERRLHSAMTRTPGARERSPKRVAARAALARLARSTRPRRRPRSRSSRRSRARRPRRPSSRSPLIVAQILRRRIERRARPPAVDALRGRVERRRCKRRRAARDEQRRAGVEQHDVAPRAARRRAARSISAAFSAAVPPARSRDASPAAGRRRPGARRTC